MDATNGLSITWLGHATVLYRSPSGKSVLVDPWMEGNPASPPDAKKLAAVAARLIGAKCVIPIHHSTSPGLTGTPDAFRKELAAHRDIEVVELKPGETAGAELARR